MDLKLIESTYIKRVKWDQWTKWVKYGGIPDHSCVIRDPGIIVEVIVKSGVNSP